MADCECIAGCPFYNDHMAGKPAMANLYKSRYCKGDFDSCARHIVFKALGKAAVPSDLFPNEGERAQKIVKGL